MRSIPACQSLVSVTSFTPWGLAPLLPLVSMLSHPALPWACISVYIAVYCVYVCIPGQVFSSVALA